MDWSTIGTILATGGVMVLGYWAQHCWAGKREIRDARRRERERIATPVREALTRLQGHIGQRWIVDTMKKAGSKGIELESEAEDLVRELEENIQRMERKDFFKLPSQLLPLVAPLTDESVKKSIEAAFLFGSMGKDLREKLGISDEDMGQKFNLAHKKLEDYVALAE